MKSPLIHDFENDGTPQFKKEEKMKIRMKKRMKTFQIKVMKAHQKLGQLGRKSFISF